METIKVNGATYWLPENNNDVITLVNDAITNNEIICLRGSGHSFPLIGDLETEKKSVTGKTYKYIMLSKMYGIEMLDANTVKVQAGCHLGVDPFDPTGISTVANSLCYQLDNMSPPLALPDLGGITHQTIGGFLSTGSSGGSTQYSFEDAVISVDVVTCQAGQGAAVTTFTRPDDNNPDDPFFAVGVASMGLLGVIVSATFRCIPQFYIAGSETIEYTDKCTTIDLFGNSPGLPDIKTFLQQTEYTRLMWWPQENNVPGTDLSRMVTWQAKRTDKAGAEAWAKHAFELINTPPTVPPLPTPPADGLKPYEEVPYIFGSPVPANFAAGLLYTAIGQWPDWLEKLMAGKPQWEIDLVKAMVEINYPTKIFPGIMDVFVTVDTPDNKNKGPQLFSDRWYTGLPMDNQMSDKLMPVWFTELWIDINQSEQVMDTLKAWYDAQPITIDLSFSTEIYAARQNDFWLSPSYQMDVIRIDVFWFGYNKGNPAEFYQSFWDLLAPFNYRPHWGKYIPDTVNGTPGVSYISEQYTKWNDWMALRDKMDPNQVFVNDYWREKLGIPVT